MSARSFELNGRRKRFGNVTVKRGCETTKVYLHGNLVCDINRQERYVKLSNCGWATRTTNTAINNVLSSLGSTARVYLVKGVTMLEYGTANRPLVNGESIIYGR